MKKTRLGAKAGQRGIIKKNNMCFYKKPVPPVLYKPHPHSLSELTRSQTLTPASFQPFRISKFTYTHIGFTFVHIGT